jgi:hypothetical protein
MSVGPAIVAARTKNQIRKACTVRPSFQLPTSEIIAIFLGRELGHALNGKPGSPKAAAIVSTGWGNALRSGAVGVAPPRKKVERA